MKNRAKKATRKATAAVTGVASQAMNSEVADKARDLHAGVFGHEMKGLGGRDDNRLLHLSAIFLCSEHVEVVGTDLHYNGTVFMRYSLTKNLHRHPYMKQERSACDDPKSPFKTRFNLERDATEDASQRFAVGFAFELTIPMSAGEATPNEVAEHYRDGYGLDTPKIWTSREEDVW